jgi:hypothetical protein
LRERKERREREKRRWREKVKREEKMVRKVARRLKRTRSTFPTRTEDAACLRLLLGSSCVGVRSLGCPFFSLHFSSLFENVLFRLDYFFFVIQAWWRETLSELRATLSGTCSEFPPHPCEHDCEQQRDDSSFFLSLSSPFLARLLVLLECFEAP